MPKISSTNNKNLLLKFVFNSLILTGLLFFGLNAILALMIEKLDINLNIAPVTEIIICAISSFVTSSICLLGFKNNYLLISLLSQIPLVIIMFVGFLVNESSFILCLVKIILIVIFCVISSILMSFKRKRR